jgi:hypothetical protein
LPLNPASLQSALESLFASPPLTRPECAQAWADAVNGYAAALVPASTTVAAGIPPLASALAAAFGTPSAASAFDAAFAAFAVTVAAGMLPTFAGGAAAFAALIDAWFRTGTATLVAPPNTLVPWS